MTGLELQPTPRSATFTLEDYFVWGGSMVRDAEDTCHLFYARWPKERGFNGWVTHSEIARAVAPDPLGPYEHRETVLPARGNRWWDGHCTHNPNVLQYDGRYLLYYMGNRGDREERGDFDFSHRNNQRIGLAVADRPSGPWRRTDEPVVAPDEDFFDSLCVTNPAVTERPDGGLLMVYNAIDDRQELPFGGPVTHAVATAPAPAGPFEKHPEPVFTAADADFPAEDPYVWYDGDRYQAIVKDQEGHFTDAGLSLAHFVSPDGFDWEPSDQPLVSKTAITWADGTTEDVNRLERPQIHLENGRPSVLFCAMSRQSTPGETWNVHIPVAASD
jgi:hypothetical protein